MKEIVERHHNCNFRLQTIKYIEHLNSPFYLDIQDTDKQQILLEVYKTAFNYMEMRNPAEFMGDILLRISVFWPKL